MYFLLLIVYVIAIFCLNDMFFNKIKKELLREFDGRFTRLEKEVFDYGSDYRRDNKDC